MKKICVLLLVFAVLLLTACGAKPYKVQNGEKTFTIDPEQKTISDGYNTYAYKISGNSAYCDVTITYPSGAVYHSQKNGNFTTGSWSDNYDESRYESGSTLVRMLSKEMPGKDRGANIGGFLILLACGLWSAIAPRSVWYLSYGWRFADAEPSDAVLIVNRVCGVLLLILAVVILFM